MQNVDNGSFSDALISVTKKYGAGLYDEAYEQAQVLLNKFPQSAVLHNTLGAILVAQNNQNAAQQHYEEALRLKKKYPEAHNNLGVLFLQRGEYEKAIKHFENSVKINDKFVDALCNLGIAYKRRGQLEKSIYYFKKGLKKDSKHLNTLISLAGAYRDIEDPHNAIKHLLLALKISPDSFSANLDLGNAYRQLGKYKYAEKNFRRAIKLAPAEPQGWNNLGSLSVLLDKKNEASRYYAKALELDPKNHEILTNYANLLFEMGSAEEAQILFETAISVNPLYVSAYTGLVKALSSLEKDSAARLIVNELKSRFPEHPDTYRASGYLEWEDGMLTKAKNEFLIALKLRPNDTTTLNDLGVVCRNLGQDKLAIKFFSLALEIDPQFLIAMANIANLYIDRGEFALAEVSLKRAISINPNDGLVRYIYGNLCKETGKLEESIDHFKSSLLIDNQSQATLAGLAASLAACDWESLEQFQRENKHFGLKQPISDTVVPLILEDNAIRQRQRVEKLVAKKYGEYDVYPTDQLPDERPERLRLAYVSADFHNFPGMYLMVGMLEHHDRSRFEVYAFSHGPDVEDEMRKRLVNGVDHFIDIRDMDDDEVVAMARNLKIDIAFNRNGFTKNHRTSLFAKRLAPIQINYLGYPCTLGAPFIDYIIADEVLVPGERRDAYTEKIIYMPHSYQPNDATRQIANVATSRTDFGLPIGAKVLCCFNQPRKIIPAVFDIWMRILREAEDSVLWLISTNPVAMKNLRTQAIKRGVEADRLIFAELLPHASHLARHKHADLCIDTFNYNAHTTASDALWAGCPFVTKEGEQFAARVASSLLHAIDVPELVARSDEEYEELILKLLEDEALLGKVRAKVKENRFTTPLFDTFRYARQFEQGLEAAYEKVFRRQEPEDIRVICE